MNEENLRVILGIKLRQYRQRQNRSLKDVAKEAGVSVSYLNEIEKGKKYPKTDKMISLAEALDVGYDELVSMKLAPKLSPLGDLLSTNLLQQLPLDVFGIDLTDLMSIMADTPDKFGSLISTLVEFARMYDVKIEQFYFATLRSYQEIHQNYFDELEIHAAAIQEKFFVNGILNASRDDLKEVLEKEYGYTVDFNSLQRESGLHRYRTVFLPDKMTLLVNPKLSKAQQRFSLAKELGYAWLGIKDRAQTSSWLKVESFDHVFNNFQASYVGGALIMPKDSVIADADVFFNKSSWEPTALQEMLERYQATPEMLFYRWSELLPTFLNIDQIYFLRFFNRDGETNYNLNKELHFSELHSPHGLEFSEHYCRRWVTLRSLMDLQIEKEDKSVEDPLIIQAQRSRFWGTENEYLNLSIARPLSLRSRTNSCVTIGIRLDKDMKEKIRFWNDAAMPVREVGQTCERCGIENCDVRAVEPAIYQEEKEFEQTQKLLEKLNKTYE